MTIILSESFYGQLCVILSLAFHDNDGVDGGCHFGVELRVGCLTLYNLGELLQMSRSEGVQKGWATEQ